MTRRLNFMVLFVLCGIFMFTGVPGEASAQDDTVPEVILEAYSTGFYRPAWYYHFHPLESVIPPVRAVESDFDERLRFALNWSGYVDLLPPPESAPQMGPTETAPSGGPPMHLHIAFQNNDSELRAHVRLMEENDSLVYYQGSVAITAQNVMRSAEAAAEELLRRVTGMTPPFRSRIVCVEQRENNVKELIMLSFDGSRRWPLTQDNSIALSPSWSPDGKKIVFCSFRAGRDADLYVADLDRRRISALIQREGTDAAPAWSPDGNWITFAGSGGASTDIYLIRVDGTELRNITSSPSIDTSPSWSPTSREIVFMSDRAGTPQIYRMDLHGANLRRLTYDGSYNAEPAWSPAGDRIVYVRLGDNGFQLRMMTPTGESDIPLTTEAGDHLEPSWSPDGMKITYSYRGRLWVMNSDGTQRRPLLADGLMSDWMPLNEQ